MATPDVDEQRKKIQKIRKEAAAAQSANFSRIMNLDVKVDKDGTRATVILPGLSYDDFDRTGNLSTHKICRMLEIRKTNLLPRLEVLLEKGRGTRMAVAQTHWFSQNFYKQATIQFPYYCLITLGYLSRSSYSLITQAQNKDSDVFCEVERHFASGDPKTGTSVPFKDDVLHAVSPLFTKTKSKVPEPPPAPPGDQMYTSMIKVRHSDTDILFHVNQAAYILYCMESATEACMAGFFTSFHGDLAWYHIEKISTRFHGEAYAEDELTVHTWESKEVANTLYFNIKKRNKMICTSVFTYYPTRHYSNL